MLLFSCGLRVNQNLQVGLPASKLKLHMIVADDSVLATKVRVFMRKRKMPPAATAERTAPEVDVADVPKGNLDNDSAGLPGVSGVGLVVLRALEEAEAPMLAADVWVSAEQRKGERMHSGTIYTTIKRLCEKGHA